MNRRTFLCGLGKFLGAAAAVKVAPIVFDLGRILEPVPGGKIYRIGDFHSSLFKEKYLEMSLNHYNSPNPLLARIQKRYSFSGAESALVVPSVEALNRVFNEMTKNETEGPSVMYVDAADWPGVSRALGIA